MEQLFGEYVISDDKSRLITTSDPYRNLKGVLGTHDAHGLYRQFDFETVDTLMRRMPDFKRNGGGR